LESSPTSPRTANTPAKQIYLDDLAAEVDEIRFSERFQSTSAVMRHLIERGLTAAGYLPDGE
jgi:hypothetical protein